MKKKLQNAINAINARLTKNTLSEDAAALWEEVKAAFEALIEDTDEHNITELQDKFAELSAKYAEQNEEVAERIQAVKNELMAQFNAGKSVKDKMTADVCKEVVNAISNSRGRESVKDAVNAVLKRNDISDLTFAEAVRIAVSFESKPTELFDAFGRTDLDKVYLVGIDEEDKDQIAKQWADNPNAVKDVQALAAEGITIATAYIYKKQRMSNEALDNAREHGREAEVENETSRELEQQVKRLAEKSAIVGDNINDAGKKVTTFQAIGKTTTTNGRVAVVHPAGANPELLDLAKTADKVEGAISEKVCVIDKDLARTLSAFIYGSGGSQTILSDEQIASQIGVARLIKVDYMSEVEGLHAVVLKPEAYKVRIKNEIRVAYPKYENNSIYYQYELNMGGALVELKSAAVLRDASGSSKASK